MQFPEPNVDCNATCCSYGNGSYFCFSDFNFTDKGNLTYVSSWEVGVRWIYTILITSIGFCGNLAIILILLKNRLLLKTSVNRFILNMACADFILACLGPVPFTITDTHQFYVLGRVWCHLEGYIQILVMAVSSLSLAIISFDRMRGIIWPFYSHFKMWQSDVIIAVVWLSSAAFALPFMFFRVYNVRIWKDMTEMVCGEDEWMGIWWVCTIVVLIWIPVSVMLISYSTIWLHFMCSKSTPKLKEHPAIAHLKRRVVRMMFVVVMGFIFCWGPFHAFCIFKYFNTDEHQRYTDKRSQKQLEIFSTVSQYFMYINPAFNPIVYGLMHQTFQRAFKLTFSCFFSKKQKFILMRGQGPNRYAWSLRSSASKAYGQDLEANVRCHRPQRRRVFCKEQITPAVVAMSATVAAIALDNSGSPADQSSKEGRNMRNNFKKRIQKKDLKKSSNNLKKIYKISSKDEKGRPRKSSNSDSDFNTEELETKIHGHEECVIAIVNEGFQNDPQIHRRGGSAFISTGALGHLIQEVIEEEASSDLVSERYL